MSNPKDHASSTKQPVNSKILSPTEVVKKMIGALATDEMRVLRLPEDTSHLPTPTPMPQNNQLSENQPPIPSSDAPWSLQQFLDGNLDLDVELSKRFPSMPMMAQIQMRAVGAKDAFRVATFNSQDGHASFTVDVDTNTKTAQFSFMMGSMLNLRFVLNNLNDMDRTRWLELMRREQGGLAFLWGASRWTNDYLVCIVRKNHTNIYAFSTHRFEAGIRLTPPMSKQFIDWLDETWKINPTPSDSNPTVLTW
jgi:hypothetical protein